MKITLLLATKRTVHDNKNNNNINNNNNNKYHIEKWKLNQRMAFIQMVLTEVGLGTRTSAQGESLLKDHLLNKLMFFSNTFCLSKRNW